MNIGIVAQRGNDRAAELAANLRRELADVDVAIDEATASAIGETGVPVDGMTSFPLVVSVGGDGTFLYTARHVGSTPILGVNLGEVGFLNAVPPEAAADAVRGEVDRIRETGSPRFREVGRIVAEGDGWSLGPGLNEVLVGGRLRGHGQGLDVDVRIDGSTYLEGHADGVIVATPTGSTAYNLSEAGPLLHPGVDGFVVNGMCAEDSMPPIVIDRTEDVEIDVSGVDRAIVATDGSERRWLDPPTTITVREADVPARIAGPRSDFFRALEKLD